MNKWRDQHLKTCTCKRCAELPAAPEPAVLDVTRPQASIHRDAIVFDGKSPFMPELDLSVANPPPPPKPPAVTWDSLTEFMEKYTLKYEFKPFKFQPQVIYSNHVMPSSVYWISSTFQVSGSVVWGTAWAPPDEPPTVELLESSNPFARVLDAWQTGKAGWTKGVTFRREPLPEGVST